MCAAASEPSRDLTRDMTAHSPGIQPIRTTYGLSALLSASFGPRCSVDTAASGANIARPASTPFPKLPCNTAELYSYLPHLAFPPSGSISGTDAPQALCVLALQEIKER